jgi:hypothetical protein
MRREVTLAAAEKNANTRLLEFFRRILGKPPRPAPDARKIAPPSLFLFMCPPKDFGCETCCMWLS